MSPPRVSVVVLNRDRRRSLARTLKALRHQTLRGFDLVIVTNRPRALPLEVPDALDARIVGCPGPGVSLARNLGINAAGGEVIAFCDDDAVPEPTWLAHLTEPFQDERLGAVGGLVRGRNGVSIQWGFQEVDQMGNDWPLSSPTSTPSDGRTLKTVGTNCAFRREALREIGGFDEAFRFFLDETDVNWRLTANGWKSALIAEAEVHHAYSASQMRTSERVPRSLFEIGASKVYFCRKHDAPVDLITELDGFRDGQRRRLVRAMLLGLLAPSDVEPLMSSLEEGYLDGATRSVMHAHIGPAQENTRPYDDGPAPQRQYLTCTLLDRRAKRRQARDIALSGGCATLFDMERTARPLTVRFTEEGFWYHRGGTFGKGERSDPHLRYSTSRNRLNEEFARTAPQRGLN